MSLRSWLSKGGRPLVNLWDALHGVQNFTAAHLFFLAKLSAA